MIPYPGNLRYQVGRFGAVVDTIPHGELDADGKPKFPPKPLRQSLNEHGKPRVTLVYPDGRRTHYVARLVLETYMGPCPEGMEACHDPDPNPANNCVENLKWGVHRETLKHRRRRPKKRASKLTESDARQIIDLLANGMPRAVVAKQFGVTYEHVRLIDRGEAWGYLQDPQQQAARQARLAEREEECQFKIAKIREMLAAGLPAWRGAALRGVLVSRVRQIADETEA